MYVGKNVRIDPLWVFTFCTILSASQRLLTTVNRFDGDRHPRVAGDDSCRGVAGWSFVDAMHSHAQVHGNQQGAMDA